MVGDIHHCGNGRTSDHCPNAVGVVRAFDIDSDGIPAGALAEHLRLLGLNGDQRLRGGGYVIFNRRIASELSISEHTAATHVAKILKKLGLKSRAQIGSWLSEQQGPAKP